MHGVTKYEAYEKKGGEGPSATKTEEHTPVATMAYQNPGVAMRSVPIASSTRRAVAYLVTLKKRKS